MKNKKKRFISTILSAVVIAGTIGSMTSNLYASTRLPMPERPTLRNVFTPKNIGGTFSTKGNAGYFITELNTVKKTLNMKTFEDVTTADGVGLLTDVVQVSGAGAYGHALKADGTVWTLNGEPKQIAGLTDIVQTTGDSQTGYALKADGTVWSLKGNQVSAGNLTDIVQITGHESKSGMNYTGGYALKADGTVWSLRGNQASVGKVSDVIQVSGYPGSYACRELKPGGGTYSCSHYNGFALNKDGTVWDLKGTKQVPNLNDIVMISGHQGVGYALKADGTVWSLNGTQILGVSDMVSISGTANDGFALKSDGTFWRLSASPTQVDGIQMHMLYNFNNPQSGKTYQGGETISIDWEMVSNPVESFDIYYIPLGEEKNQSAWVEIEKDVSVSSLNPQTYESPIKDEGGNFLTGTKYSYDWELPNEFMRFVKVATIPNYK